MPGRTAYKKKRQALKRKSYYNIRTMKKGYAMARFPITNIKRKCNKADFLINNSLSLAYNFALSDLSGSSDFTNLFDFYRICGVKLHFIPQANSNDTGTVDNLSIPVIHYIADYDDNIGPANENAILEKQNVKTRRLDKPFTYYLKPKISDEIYNNGITTAYALNKGNQWIDCNSSSVAHFGLKGWISSAIPSGNAVMRLKIYATYYLQFKGAQ